MSLITVESIDLDQEHQALRQEVAEWREWWRELREMGQPRFGEMGGRLTRFRGHLLSHFRHEQESGPMADQAAEICETGYRVRQLFDEHDQLLRQLDRLITQLNEGGARFDSWETARMEFESFLDRLQAHDVTEQRLLDEMKSGR